MSVKQVNISRLLKITGALLAAALVIYVMYPWAICWIYGKDVPAAWTSELGEMNFEKIYERLGPPQEFATAKDYQIWLERHWWGVKVLKVIASGCCQHFQKPDEVIYIVYVKGRYEPIYQNVIVGKICNAPNCSAPNPNRTLSQIISHTNWTFSGRFFELQAYPKKAQPDTNHNLNQPSSYITQPYDRVR
jgi:hypothetical protein